MITRRQLGIFLMVILLLIPIVTVNVSAATLGVFYRPAMTFLVENAPEDLILRLDVPRNGEMVPIYLYREDRLWESVFRLFRQTAPFTNFWIGNSRADFENAVLVAMTREDETPIPLTERELQHLTMNDYFTLDLSDHSLSFGLPLWRTILLFLLRVGLTTSVALIILGFFKYRFKKSWITVLVTNLICQCGCSLFLSNLINFNPKLIFILILILFAVLLTQILVFIKHLKELPMQKAVTYGFWSNVATGALNILFMLQFPM